jgi:hypothetical protein
VSDQGVKGNVIANQKMDFFVPNLKNKKECSSVVPSKMMDTSAHLTFWKEGGAKFMNGNINLLDQMVHV